jgi:hypothetical protein
MTFLFYESLNYSYSKKKETLIVVSSLEREIFITNQKQNDVFASHIKEY